MSATSAQAERQHKIHQVIDYIFTHLNQEITIQTLSKVAHYSPFHLQKLFKQFVGESPKQYALKLRLETAFHLLIIHPHKSIQEIALDGGFSSPAVFSRAMKNNFGYSPEQLRQLPHRAQMKILHGNTPASQVARPKQDPAVTQVGIVPSAGHPIIHVIRKEPVNGIYQLAPFNQAEKVQQAFQALLRFAVAHNLCTKYVYGILAPHQRNSYKTFLPFSPDWPLSPPFPQYEIEGGTFATFTVSGDLKQTSKVAHYFIHCWLPENGYKIAGINGFETFSGNPAATPYFQLQRQIHIPIEPVL